MKLVYCPKCKGTIRQDYTWTDFFRACCPVQFLIQDTKICFNCLSKVEAILVMLKIQEPVENCSLCDIEECPVSSGMRNASKLNCEAKETTFKEQCGPEDLRDDWPHAIPVPGGAWQINKHPRQQHLVERVKAPFKVSLLAGIGGENE